jgi:hypothetical protein
MSCHSDFSIFQTTSSPFSSELMRSLSLCGTLRFKQLVISEVLVEVTTKSTIFWNVTPNSLIEVRCFGGKYCLHLQGRRLRPGNKQASSSTIAVASCSEVLQLKCCTNFSIPRACCMSLSAQHLPESTNYAVFSSLLVTSVRRII